MGSLVDVSVPLRFVLTHVGPANRPVAVGASIAPFGAYATLGSSDDQKVGSEQGISLRWSPTDSVAVQVDALLRLDISINYLPPDLHLAAPIRFLAGYKF